MLYLISDGMRGGSNKVDNMSMTNLNPAHCIKPPSFTGVGNLHVVSPDKYCILERIVKETNVNSSIKPVTRIVSLLFLACMGDGIK